MELEVWGSSALTECLDRSSAGVTAAMASITSRLLHRLVLVMLV